MTDNQNTHTGQLQDLIQVLTERIDVYTTAISSVDSSKDVDLIALFEKCMQISQQFKSELLVILPTEGSSYSQSEWTAGMLYNTWKKQNPCPLVSGREQVLEACRKMEEVMENIFKQVLSSSNNFSENTAAVLKSQTALQQEIYELLKDLEKGNSN